MKELHLALIGGPQYDGLLDLLPALNSEPAIGCTWRFAFRMSN